MLKTCMGKPTLKRWPTAVWFFMLGITQVNGFTILQFNRGEDVNRLEMRLVLAVQLTAPRLQERVASPIGLNADILAALATVTGKSAARPRPATPNEQVARGRCVTCLKEFRDGRGSGHRTAKERIAKYPPCSVCEEFVCKVHSTNLRVCK